MSESDYTIQILPSEYADVPKHTVEKEFQGEVEIDKDYKVLEVAEHLANKYGSVLIKDRMSDILGYFVFDTNTSFETIGLKYNGYYLNEFQAEFYRKPVN
ncbi:MAG: hypothetical protein KC414_14005 [Romboutsia sp.]|nr:hypothetical protein [Romboutsia sp.]